MIEWSSVVKTRYGAWYRKFTFVTQRELLSLIRETFVTLEFRVRLPLLQKLGSEPRCLLDKCFSRAIETIS